MASPTSIHSGPYLRIAAFGALCLVPMFGQSLPPGLKNYLEGQVKFTSQELASVASGQGVAKALEAQGEELGVVGAVYINVPPEYLFRAYAQFDKFEPAGALQYGRFSNPAKASDVAKLTLDAGDLKELRDCKPGDCGLVFPDQAIERFRKEIDWKAGDAAAKANTLYRTMLVNYVNEYQKRGEEALLSVHNRKDVQSIRDGLRELMAHTPIIAQATPQLTAHMQQFPRNQRADSKDYFFWIKSDTGMQPVTSAAHMVIHKEVAPNGKTIYAFAARALYGNRYFRDAIAYRFLVPATGDADPKALYYVNITRAHADGLTGMKAKLIRGKLVTGMQKSTTEQMTATKKVIEDWYRQYAPAAK